MHKDLVTPGIPNSVNVTANTTLGWTMEDGPNVTTNIIAGGVALAPGNGASTVLAMFAELWGSFLFAMTVCCIASVKSRSSSNGGWNGFTAILALAVAIYITAPISGGGINPAVAIGLNVMSSLLAGNNKSIGNLWAYIVGPLLGGAMAGCLWKYYH